MFVKSVCQAAQAARILRFCHIYLPAPQQSETAADERGPKRPPLHFFQLKYLYDPFRRVFKSPELCVYDIPHSLVYNETLVCGGRIDMIACKDLTEKFRLGGDKCRRREIGVERPSLA